MPKAEGVTLKMEGHDAIRPDLLETIAYGGRKQTICCETDEFSAVCPFSGLPDISLLQVEYIPGKLIIELKSLKYYLTSFRSVGIYQEEATDRIFSDLLKLLEPQWLKVTTTYNLRGGIGVTCAIDSKDAG